MVYSSGRGANVPGARNCPLAATASSNVKSVVMSLMAITIGLISFSSAQGAPNCKIPPETRVKPKNYTAVSPNINAQHHIGHNKTALFPMNEVFKEI